MIANDINIFLKDIKSNKSISYNKEYNRVAKLHKYWSRKPWYIIEKYILKYTKENQTILDPFMGSGTVGLESILNKRNFIGYDLNPIAYFLASQTLSNIDINIIEFSQEIDQLKKSVFNEILDLYKINNSEIILYYIAGKKKDKPYNTVLSDINFKNKKKVSLPKNILEKEYKINLPFPDCNFPDKFYKDRFSYKGYKKVSDFFSSRNLKALTILYNHIINSDYKYRDLFILGFSNTLLHVSKLKAENVRPLSVNNYWIPDDYIQENVIWRFLDRVENIKQAKLALKKRWSYSKYEKLGQYKLYNRSSIVMNEIKDSSIDYIITDPPYGETIQYSELSYIWNCWMKKAFDINEEIIINPKQDKGLNEFITSIRLFIKETKRVLKDGGIFTLCFQNKDVNIWKNILEIIHKENFGLIDVNIYDTLGNPFNKNWAKFSPKADLYITFQKNKLNKIPKTKNTTPSEIINAIIDYFNSENTSFFDLNKAYDIFVATTIHYMFNGTNITGLENINLTNIIKTFENRIDNGIKERTHIRNIQTKLPF